MKRQCLVFLVVVCLFACNESPTHTTNTPLPDMANGISAPEPFDMKNGNDLKRVDTLPLIIKKDPSYGGTITVIALQRAANSNVILKQQALPCEEKECRLTFPFDRWTETPWEFTFNAPGGTIIALNGPCPFDYYIRNYPARITFDTCKLDTQGKYGTYEWRTQENPVTVTFAASTTPEGWNFRRLIVQEPAAITSIGMVPGSTHHIAQLAHTVYGKDGVLVSSPEEFYLQMGPTGTPSAEWFLLHAEAYSSNKPTSMHVVGDPSDNGNPCPIIRYAGSYRYSDNLRCFQQYNGSSVGKITSQWIGQVFVTYNLLAPPTYLIGVREYDKGEKAYRCTGFACPLAPFTDPVWAELPAGSLPAYSDPGKTLVFSERDMWYFGNVGDVAGVTHFDGTKETLIVPGTSNRYYTNPIAALNPADVWFVSQNYLYRFTAGKLIRASSPPTTAAFNSVTVKPLDGKPNDVGTVWVATAEGTLWRYDVASDAWQREPFDVPCHDPLVEGSCSITALRYGNGALYVGLFRGYLATKKL